MTDTEAFRLWLAATYPNLAAQADKPEGFDARGTVALIRSAWDARGLWEKELALPEARRVWP